MAFKAPYLPYEELRIRADAFLTQYHPTRSIPVPIEEIIEIQFRMDIVPMPGLGNIDVLAYLSQDLKEIRVDESIQRERPRVYRLSIAHELAHKILHAEVFRELKFSNVDGWKHLISDVIPEDQYGYLEFHAYSFAGLILVPPAELRNALFDYIEPAQAAGVDFDDIGNGARDSAEFHVAGIFDVSPTVIHRRIEFDKLWHG